MFYKLEGAKGGRPRIRRVDEDGAILTATGDRKPDMASLYRDVAFLRRCVNLRADSVASIPLVLHDSRGSEIWDVHNEIPPEAWRWLSGLTELVKLMEMSGVLTARAYALKRRSAGRPDAPAYYAPQTMRVVAISEEGDPTRFLREVTISTDRGMQSMRREYDRDDLIYATWPDAYGELIGSPQAQAAREASEVLQTLNRTVDGFLDRGLIKATVLMSEDELLTEEDASKLRKYWNRMVRRRTGETIVLHKSVKPMIVGEGLEGLDISDLARVMREEIAVALGVPVSMLLPDAANMATRHRDTLDFLSLVVLPEAKRIVDAINADLLSEMGAMLVMHPERMEAFQQSELEKAKGIIQLTGQPIMTVEEGRMQMGLDPERDFDISLRRVKLSELKKWRKKVESKGRETPFAPKYLSTDEAEEVGMRLAEGYPLDMVFADVVR